jgi:nucleotide-binding universal stress UspA family protein
MVCALLGEAKRLKKCVNIRKLASVGLAMKKAKGVEADQKLESGGVGKKIGQVAKKEGYDMIVMGGKGHGGIRRFLLGSASNHVLHYTVHAVLIVK